MKIRHSLALLPLVLAFPLPAGAISVVVDYSYDTSGFFPVGGTARSTLEQAASDLSAVLANGQLSALSTTSYTGLAGGANASVDWTVQFLHPVTEALTALPAPNLAADEFRIFVGWHNLGGSTLGQGSSGGAGFSLSGGGSPGGFPGAVDAMEALSNPAMTRGGPVFETYSGAFGSTTYSLDYGPLVGSLWFDSDRDGVGGTDSQAQLETSWNLGMGAPGGAQTDFYSVALHEMIHAIGFGQVDAFTSLQPDPLLSGAHFVSGTMSTRLSDGLPQLAIMNPTINSGTRRTLTAVDLEYLGKIGFTTVPEPGAAGLLGALGLAALTRRGRRAAPRAPVAA